MRDMAENGDAMDMLILLGLSAYAVQVIIGLMIAAYIWPGALA